MSPWPGVDLLRFGTMASLLGSRAVKRSFDDAARDV